MDKQHFLELRKQYIEQQFQQLNEMQRDAVFSCEGPLLILAGAGSGKTTVLVNRIANLIRFGRAHSAQHLQQEIDQTDIQALQQLIAQGGQPSERLAKLLCECPVYPYHILAITFTNKAAAEMKGRLAAMLGQAGQDVHASTFHSACVRILRRDAVHLGYPSSFTIYDTDDQQRVMKEVYRELSIDDKLLAVKAAVSGVGRLKDQMISPQEALAEQQNGRKELLARVYAAYQKKLLAAGAMDFDDLIYNTVRLLSEKQELREWYQSRFRYVLVDEYQDTSIAQFRLVYLLAGSHGNICVVGDDDQSIYRFRGATIENILSFEEHFPNARVIRLEQNYRSTSNILQAANCVIRNNAARKGKTLWTGNAAGDKLTLFKAQSELDEAAWIVSVIGQNVKKGVPLRQHAVLYRMNAQSGPIENYFVRAGIPYKILAGRRFYDRKEVKDILSYMSIVTNPRDDLRLRRIINEPARKIGAATVQTVADLAQQQGCSMLEVLQNMQDYPQLARASAALGGFMDIYQKLCRAQQELALDEFARVLVELTGYRAMLNAAGDEGKTRLENIGQLISSMKTYADEQAEQATLAGFLEEVALISDMDSYDEQADVVILMTMHAAKGLEFDYVFLVGMEEGVFPGEMSRYSQEDLEEERRLCYVGITRAKKELYLSCAAARMMFGQTKRYRPSRFLQEIDDELLGECNASAAEGLRTAGVGRVAAMGTARNYRAGFGRPVRAGTASAVPLRVQQTEAVATAFAPGDRVEHRVFGMGTVLKVTPVATDCIVEIHFDTVGVKKTMANYAPMKKVDC